MHFSLFSQKFPPGKAKSLSPHLVKCVTMYTAKHYPNPPPSPPSSLWRTTSPPRRTATGRRWCWTARRSRSTSWTRRARRTTPPSGTTTSAAARASCSCSPSRSKSPSAPPWSSGTRPQGLPLLPLPERWSVRYLTLCFKPGNWVGC